MSRAVDDLRGEKLIDARDVRQRMDDLQDTLDFAWTTHVQEVCMDEEVAEALETDDRARAAYLDAECPDEVEELRVLTELWDDIPSDTTLIADWYFTEYAQELAFDLYGKELRHAEWPFSCIDWEAAADALRQDYTQVEFDGTTYLYRE